MRIDASEPGFVGPWQVFHVPTARAIPQVCWVDDQMPAYGTYNPEATRATGERVTDVHYVKRIEILTQSRIVLIDPIEDSDAPPIAETRELQAQ